MASRYAEVYAGWRRDPEAFWHEAARAIDWIHPPGRIFDPASGPYGRWFPDATLNLCHNALDRHADGRPARPGGADPRQPRHRHAGALHLRRAARRRGDAGGRAGRRGRRRGRPRRHLHADGPRGDLRHAGLRAHRRRPFGGVRRLRGGRTRRPHRRRRAQADPHRLLRDRARPHRPLQAAARRGPAPRPPQARPLPRPGSARRRRPRSSPGRDRDWAEAVAAAEAAGARAVACTVRATDPLYILYTSGTTGLPKGVVRDTGGYAVALAWSMPNLYGVAPGERSAPPPTSAGWWATATSSTGRCSTAPPPCSTRASRSARPTPAPSGASAPSTASSPVHRPDRLPRHPQGGSRGRVLRRRTTCPRCARCSSPASGPTPPRCAGRDERFGLPVVDHWWQTETGWAIAGNPAGLGLLPVKPGSPAVPMPGFALQAVDEAGARCRPAPWGRWCSDCRCRPARCPRCGATTTAWRELPVGLPGYYETGDAGIVDADGYVCVMGRTDDIINVAGHRLSTGGMEEVLARHPDVAECAVIGVRDALKGEAPLRLPRAEGRGGARPRRGRGRGRGAGARAHRPGRRLQARRGGGPAAQDPLRQDPARHHEEDRRRRRLDAAGHHRGPGVLDEIAGALRARGLAGEGASSDGASGEGDPARLSPADRRPPP